MRAARLDLTRGFDEIDSVIVMLFDAGGNREDIGIEDDIFRRKTNAGEQLVGPLANLYLAIFSIGLAHFIERHDHHSRAIIHALAGMIQECLFAFLHRNRIDDRLAGHAFQPGLDH